MFSRPTNAQRQIFCRRPKKVGGSFALFRNMVKIGYRSACVYLTDDDDQLNNVASERWQSMNSDFRKQWKDEAARIKILQRCGKSYSSCLGEECLKTLYEETMSQINSQINHHSPSDDDSAKPKQKPKPFARSRRSKKTSGSILAADERDELLACSEKRRHKTRVDLAKKFGWSFDANIKEFSKCSFCLLAAQPLRIIDGTLVEPAEIACVEFNFDQGIVDFMCHPIRPQDNYDYATCAQDMERLRTTTHQFSVDTLKKIGSSYDTVAKSLADFASRRHPVGHPYFYFIFDNALEETFSCLNYLVNKSNTAGPETKSLTVLDVACIEDLASAAFEHMGIKNIDECFSQPVSDRISEYSSSCSDGLAFDFDNIFSGVECTMIYRCQACEAHREIMNAKCSLSELFLISEILCTAAKNKQFDLSSMQKFIKDSVVMESANEKPAFDRRSAVVVDKQRVVPDRSSSLTSPSIPEEEKLRVVSVSPTLSVHDTACDTTSPLDSDFDSDSVVDRSSTCALDDNDESISSSDDDQVVAEYCSPGGCLDHVKFNGFDLGHGSPSFQQSSYQTNSTVSLDNASEVSPLTSSSTDHNMAYSCSSQAHNDVTQCAQLSVHVAANNSNGLAPVENSQQSSKTCPVNAAPVLRQFYSADFGQISPLAFSKWFKNGNTDRVQHLLPYNKRGLGRGLHLLSEGSLLDDLARMRLSGD